MQNDITFNKKYNSDSAVYWNALTLMFFIVLFAFCAICLIVPSFDPVFLIGYVVGVEFGMAICGIGE